MDFSIFFERNAKQSKLKVRADRVSSAKNKHRATQQHRNALRRNNGFVKLGRNQTIGFDRNRTVGVSRNITMGMDRNRTARVLQNYTSFCQQSLPLRKNLSIAAARPPSPQSIMFLHIKKTGGSTLHGLLGRLEMKNDTITYFTTEGPKWPRDKDEDPFHGRDLSIVVVRDPIDRVISHYWQLKPTDTYKGGADKSCTGACDQHTR